MTPSAAAGRVLAAVLANPVNAALLSALNDDLLPNWYLTAGCVCQSVWSGSVWSMVNLVRLSLPNRLAT